MFFNNPLPLRRVGKKYLVKEGQAVCKWIPITKSNIIAI